MKNIQVKSETMDDEEALSSFAVASDEDIEASAEPDHQGNDHDKEEEAESPEQPTEGSNHNSLDDSEPTNEQNATAGPCTNGGNLADSISFSLLCESSRMAMPDIVVREQRCRILEREANEVKDVLCTMNHLVHILENIKRVSREYIHKLYELNEGTTRQDKEAVALRQQDIFELEVELKQWERKYSAMSSFNSQMSLVGNATEAMLAATKIAMANGSQGSMSDNPNDAVEDNEHSNHESRGFDSADIELESSVHGRLSQNGQNRTNPLLLMNPQELCEMSMMETHEAETPNDENGSTHRQRQRAAAAAAAAFMMNPSAKSVSAAASSPFIAAAVAAAASENAHKNLTSQLKQHLLTNSAALTRSHNQRLSSSTSSVSQSGHNGVIMKNDLLTPSLASSSSSKPLFRCEHPGCQYQTNMRQRLAMHKRAHAGEMLYSCDIPGCGYQSNYKGNIKIHKKHRHRIESNSGEQCSYIVADKNGMPQKFRTRGRKRKHHLPSAEHSAHLTGLRLPQSDSKSMSARPSVIMGEGAELIQTGEECPNSSMDMCSGNESNGARESDLPAYECSVEGCNYRTKWKQCLTAHQFLHEGVKPFRCDHPGCNYRTNFKGNVNVHKRVHRASEFVCKFAGCNFSTPWKNSFMIHQRNHVPPIVQASSSVVATPSAPTQRSLPSNVLSNGLPEAPLALSRRRSDQSDQMIATTSSNHLNFDTSSNSSLALENVPSAVATVTMPSNEHLFNGLSALQSQQAANNLLANGQFIKEEDDDDDEDDIDDEELEDEEEMMNFANSSADPNLQHAFLMNEAANAVSQAHLAALRHSVSQSDQLSRPNVMFDISRYQEMI